MSAIYLSPPDIGARERELVMEAFDLGYVAPAGPMLDRFERAFAQYVGAGHAVALSSGTAALHLAFVLAGVQPGDYVAVPTLTFIGGVAPVVYLGAEPLFVDASAASLCMDPARLEEAFAFARRQGRRIRVVSPTDLYGHPSDHDRIAEICEANGALLVPDAAEAVGSLYKGRHVGGGLAAAFSFNGNKIITTSGGGMLVSDDAALIERARYLSTAARQPAPHYEHTEVGFNYRLSSISAAIGLAQLETVEDRVSRRRQTFERYRSRLSGLAGVRFADELPDCRHSRWLTVMFADDKARATPSEVIAALAALNIEARPVWKPMHLQPVFRDRPVMGGEVAAEAFRQGVCLPSGGTLREQDIDRVCDAVQSRLS